MTTHIREFFWGSTKEAYIEHLVWNKENEDSVRSICSEEWTKDEILNRMGSSMCYICLIRSKSLQIKNRMGFDRPNDD